MSSGAALHLGLPGPRPSQPPKHRPLSIALDEWGFGPPWAVARFGAAHAMYAAAEAIPGLLSHIYVRALSSHCVSGVDLLAACVA